MKSNLRYRKFYCLCPVSLDYLQNLKVESNWQNGWKNCMHYVPITKSMRAMPDSWNWTWKIRMQLFMRSSKVWLDHLHRHLVAVDMVGIARDHSTRWSYYRCPNSPQPCTEWHKRYETCDLCGMLATRWYYDHAIDISSIPIVIENQDYSKKTLHVCVMVVMRGG